MNYLIDTQILIWLFGLTENIPKIIHKTLKHSENEIFVSAVSIWEIAIKKSVGKLTFPFELRNIVAELPYHHKDPFDRLIIAQAMIEKLPIISSDRNFNYYDIKNIW